MTSVRSSSVAILSCFLSWETSPMRPWLLIWPFIFGTRFSCPPNIVLSFRWLFYHFFNNCKTTHSRCPLVRAPHYWPFSEQNSWRRISTILFLFPIRPGTFKMNTAALELRLLSKIIEIECTRRWSLLIESHSISIVVLGLCSPLVRRVIISIARTFLFSLSKVNGYRVTMRIHLRAGSKSRINIQPFA